MTFSSVHLGSPVSLSLYKNNHHGSHLTIIGWDQTYQLQQTALTDLGHKQPNCPGHKVWFRDDPVSTKLWAAVGWSWGTNTPVAWEQQSVESSYNHQEVSPRRQAALGIKEKRGREKWSPHIIGVISAVLFPLGSQLASNSLLVYEFQLGFLLLAAKNLLSNSPDYWAVELKCNTTLQNAVYSAWLSNSRILGN